VNLSANATVRITLSQEKWPTQGRPFSCRNDIRCAKQKQFSRPMTGHTPQKLPLTQRNLLHHRSAQGVVSLRVPDYDTTKPASCQQLF